MAWYFFCRTFGALIPLAISVGLLVQLSVILCVCLAGVIFFIPTFGVSLYRFFAELVLAQSPISVVASVDLVNNSLANLLYGFLLGSCVSLSFVSICLVAQWLVAGIPGSRPAMLMTPHLVRKVTLLINLPIVVALLSSNYISAVVVLASRTIKTDGVFGSTSFLGWVALTQDCISLGIMLAAPIFISGIMLAIAASIIHRYSSSWGARSIVVGVHIPVLLVVLVLSIQSLQERVKQQAVNFVKDAATIVDGG